MSKHLVEIAQTLIAAALMLNFTEAFKLNVEANTNLLEIGSFT